MDSSKLENDLVSEIKLTHIQAKIYLLITWYGKMSALEIADKSKISGEIFNAGYENKSVLDLANTVKNVLGDDIKLIETPTNDNRSYHISSKKIQKILNFDSKFTIEDAVKDLQNAFKKNLLPNSLTDEKYFNIKRMKSIKLK